MFRLVIRQQLESETKLSFRAGESFVIQQLHKYVNLTYSVYKKNHNVPSLAYYKAT